MAEAETPAMGTRSQRTRTLAVTGTAITLALAASLPAGAAVVFEPSTEPAPERWEVSMLVTVEWASVSMRLPETWTATTRSAPIDGAAGASLLVAFGPGDSMCMLDRYRTATLETWQDVGIEATAELIIDGYQAERFDDMLGLGAPVASAYSIETGEQHYSLLCSAEEAPIDRWLSIAETIDLP